MVVYEACEKCKGKIHNFSCEAVKKIRELEEQLDELMGCVKEHLQMGEKLTQAAETTAKRNEELERTIGHNWNEYERVLDFKNKKIEQLEAQIAEKDKLIQKGLEIQRRQP